MTKVGRWDYWFIVPSGVTDVQGADGSSSSSLKQEPPPAETDEPLPNKSAKQSSKTKTEQDSLPCSCCQKDCIQQLDVAQLQERHYVKSKLGSNDEVNEFVYMLLQTMSRSDTGFKYFFLGHGLYTAALLEVLGIGASRLTRLTDWLRAGNVHPPRDLRPSTLKDAPPI